MKVAIIFTEDYFFNYIKMKRYLFILLCFIGVSCKAQTMWFKTTEYAQASIINGQYYWSDWQASDMNLIINSESDQIVIYSPKIQIYQIYGVYNNGNAYRDSSGGVNVKFYVIDQDYDKGEIRLRMEQNGNSQIYIDFSNVAWVYNVIRIR